MKDYTKENSAYAEERSKWAKAHTESFLSSLEQIGAGLGIRITPVQYVRAYKLCVEDLKFGYPAEYKLARLISTDENYEQVLLIMEELMKRYRLAFQKERKKQIEQKKRKAARRRAA